MLKIFIGYDHRQPVAYNVLAQSILSQSSKPVSITPLVLDQLPIKRQGLTPFTYSRFLVPYLCDYKDWALFLDIDIVLLDDISKLFDLADARYNVMVSKNPKRFEWASVMLMNCNQCQVLTPQYVETADNLHGLAWADEDKIGSLPSEWNHLVGYDKPRDDAKLVHYTQGIPAFPETIDSEYAEHWHSCHQSMNSAQPWEVLMGSSVHTVEVNGVKMPRFVVDEEKQAIKPEHQKTVERLLKTREQPKTGRKNVDTIASEVTDCG